MNNLHLDFIDTDQIHTLTKLSGKNERGLENGYILTGYPIVATGATYVCLIVQSEDLRSFQTANIVKVEFNDNSIKVHTANSVYELAKL